MIMFNNRDKCKFCGNFLLLKEGGKSSRFERRYRLRLVTESYDGDKQIATFENKAFKFYFCPLCGKKVHNGT